MTNLMKFDKCTDFKLSSVEGDNFVLSQYIENVSNVYLVFFKVSCPTCQFTMPFISKLGRAYNNSSIIAVSQDGVSDTKNFMNQYEVSMPILIDEDLLVSSYYKLTNVPTIFEIDNKMTIQNTVVGFSKQDLFNINKDLALNAHSEQIQLFDYDVPLYKPG